MGRGKRTGRTGGEHEGSGHGDEVRSLRLLDGATIPITNIISAYGTAINPKQTPPSVGLTTEGTDGCYRNRCRRRSITCTARSRSSSSVPPCGAAQSTAASPPHLSTARGQASPQRSATTTFLSPPHRFPPCYRPRRSRGRPRNAPGSRGAPAGSAERNRLRARPGRAARTEAGRPRDGGSPEPARRHPAAPTGEGSDGPARGGTKRREGGRRGWGEARLPGSASCAAAAPPCCPRLLRGDVGRAAAEASREAAGGGEAAPFGAARRRERGGDGDCSGGGDGGGDGAALRHAALAARPSPPRFPPSGPFPRTAERRAAAGSHVPLPPRCRPWSCLARGAVPCTKRPVGEKKALCRGGPACFRREVTAVSEACGDLSWLRVPDPCRGTLGWKSTGLVAVEAVR